MTLWLFWSKIHQFDLDLCYRDNMASVGAFAGCHEA